MDIAGEEPKRRGARKRFYVLAPIPFRTLVCGTEYRETSEVHTVIWRVCQKETRQEHLLAVSGVDHVRRGCNCWSLGLRSMNSLADPVPISRTLRASRSF